MRGDVLAGVADQIAALHAAGRQPVIVTSGLRSESGVAVESARLPSQAASAFSTSAPARA